MKNPLRVAEWTVSKVILVLWVIFSIVYVGNGIKNTVLVRVYNTGKQDGMREAVTQAVALAQKCQPVVLSVGQSQVNLLNPACTANTPKAEEEVTEEK